MPQPRIENIKDLHDWSTHDRAPFFEIALNYVTSKSSVLDVACGDGSFARLVKAEDLHLVDGNPDTVEMLKDEFAHVHLHQIPERFPSTDAYFDVVHCSHLVEHLVPQDFYDLLCEVDRVTKPGGVFVVSAPLLWQGFYDDLSHVRPYPPSVFCKYMCRKSGRNTTRRAINGNYSIELLQYRYARKPPSYFDVSTSRSWAKKLLFRGTNFLRQISFARYELSGFTLVLRKSNDLALQPSPAKATK